MERIENRSAGTQDTASNARTLRRIRLFLCMVLANLFWLMGGCPSAFPGGQFPEGNHGGDGSEQVDEPLVDGNIDPSLTSPLGKTFGEPNGTFVSPVVAVFDAEGVARLQGTVDRRGDLDVFLLGALEVGDLIEIDASSDDSALDASVGVFDDQGRLVSTNDDRCDDFHNLDCLNPRIDFTVRHGAAAYFLVMTQSAFAERGQGVGTYTFEVHRSASVVAEPRPQVLVLDFDGADVNSLRLGSYQLDPFDAERIDRVYRGATNVMIQSIVETVRQNYQRFNVTILTTEDEPPPDGTEFSVVYFGGFHPMAFGLSEAVDLYNADRCDDAIIFTESFSVSFFSEVPSAEQMGIAIGNVAAHEAGHVLGLNHVDDDLDIMDDRSSADAFLEDQEFKASALSSDIMSIGTQDGVLLLNETVGPAIASP